ncbi:MAG: TraR/DksA C4-type zinc finger protein [Chitinophagaceae bacterium]|nr:TraR/DksA C4-type zinc finger protein [Chitinophagaceae bacterium]
MATNKKAVKKAAASKTKPAKPAPKKAAKPAPKKAVKPVKQAKSAKAVAKKPAVKKATKKVVKKAVTKQPVKKPASPKAPVTPAKSKPVAKKATKEVKHQPAKHAVKQTPAVTPVKVAAPKVAQVKKETKAGAVKAKEVKPVVIPKLSTSHSRKYEPEFTQSILDQPEEQQSKPTMKYSDAELMEFKELILRKLDAAKKELNYLQGLITRKDDMGGDESENRYMTMEDGSISMEREQLSQMASRQIQYIDHLEKAMMRIENKTYGICRVTGKLIDKARLRAVPHATLSIEAKMGFAKNPNIQ